MDGIHDLGGMHGFGRIEREPDEPVFHARWEARMFALASAVPFVVPFGDDQFRRELERMAPEHYLRSSYYEKWHAAVSALLREHGVLDGPPRRWPAPLPAERVDEAILAGASQACPDAADVPIRFAVGERVRTRSHMGAGHNRLPRYARGRIGTIEAIHGAFVVADRNAATGDRTPETLYTVRFDAVELWGEEADPRDQLSLDLWDPYLEPLR